MSEPARLIVFAPNWLGDAVMALPAIDDLRRHLNAGVTVAGRASVARLFRLVPWVDDVVELEWRSRIGELGALRRDAQRLRATRANVALLLPNSFASAWLALTARIPQRWGYARDGRSWLLTRAIERPAPRGLEIPLVHRSPNGEGGSPKGVGGNPEPRAPSPEPRAPNPVPVTTGMHQGAYYQHLVHALGAPNGPLEPRVVVPPQAMTEARALVREVGWDGIRRLIVCAPGAAYGSAKRWWPTHYAQLATDLVLTRGAHVALVGGPADAEATGEVIGLLPSTARPFVSDLAGQTTLEVLAGVMALAQVCVSNDSGAMHLAAAVGTPLAAIFGPTNERETSPLVHAPLELLIHPVPCRPCMLRECPIDHPCMRDLAPAHVLTTVTRLMDAPEVAR